MPLKSEENGTQPDGHWKITSANMHKKE